ncbi:hypothetical protein NG791_15895 [Laspinema sp. D1]|nr:hypothetical protein [Laspinema sp. D2b]
MKLPSSDRAGQFVESSHGLLKICQAHAGGTLPGAWSGERDKSNRAKG